MFDKENGTEVTTSKGGRKTLLYMEVHETKTQVWKDIDVN